MSVFYIKYPPSPAFQSVLIRSFLCMVKGDTYLQAPGQIEKWHFVPEMHGKLSKHMPILQRQPIHQVCIENPQRRPKACTRLATKRGHCEGSLLLYGQTKVRDTMGSHNKKNKIVYPELEQHIDK
jgi:hypothetical protein